MNYLLDLMGSSLIAGILLLLILKLNLYSSSANYYSDNELRLQQNAKTLAEIINHDFRKITSQYDKRVKKPAGKVFIHRHSPINVFSGVCRINTLPAPAP